MLVALLLKRILIEVAVEVASTVPGSDIIPVRSIAEQLRGPLLQSKVAVNPLEVSENGVSDGITKSYTESALAKPTATPNNRNTRTTA
jgi:hypothetical protein